MSIFLIDFDIIRPIIIVAIILSCTFIISRNYFLRQLNKLETTLALISLVFSIPLFINDKMDIIYKIATILAIVVIIILMKYLEVIRGRNVTKVLGDSPEFIGKIQAYKFRNDIPLERIIKEANKELIFLSISNIYLLKYNEDLILEAILDKNLNIIIWTLDPNSKYVDGQSYIFGKGVKGDINESIELLEKLRAKVSQDKLIMKLYDADIPHSLIVTDLNSDNSLAKIDKHMRNTNPDYRPSQLVYKRDSLKAYNDFIRPLLEIKGDIQN